MASALTAPPSRPWTLHLVRFATECAAWCGYGALGWSLADGGATGTLPAAGMTVATMALWAVPRVRNDPPGKMDPSIVIDGRLRLILELVFFTGAGATWWLAGNRIVAESLWTVVVVFYAVTWDHGRWMWRQRPCGGTRTRIES